jgi:predicted HTH transcriptional regulator
MALPLKSLERITEADLLALIQAGQAESKIIEYKETLPGNADTDKKEFLYDVSSFANAVGGTLVYGMKAQDGVPVGLIGISGLTPDAEKLRLNAIIQSGVQPRIPGVQIETVGLANTNKALLIGIPRSWASPHMITFKGTSKFYSRHSNGKYQLAGC